MTCFLSFVGSSWLARYRAMFEVRVRAIACLNNILCDITSCPSNLVENMRGDSPDSARACARRDGELADCLYP